MSDNEDKRFPALTPAHVGGILIETTSGRDLHAFLGVGKDFSTWFKDRVDQYGFTENVDFCILPETGENAGSDCSPKRGSKARGGHNRKEYAISLDMAKELSMVERNEQGKAARLYFIECERRAKAAVPAIDVRNVPQLQTIALQLIEVNREQSEKIAVMAPKVEAFEMLEASEGSVGPRLAAKMLDWPEKKFTAWLQSNHWAFRQNGVGPLQAYAEKRNAGYLEHRAHTYRDQVRGEDRTIAQLMITPKGLAKLASTLSEVRA